MSNRYGKKETPQEYKQRHERMAVQKKERTERSLNYDEDYKRETPQEYKQRHAKYAEEKKERASEWSNDRVTGMTKYQCDESNSGYSGYKIGSTADPSAARQMYDEIEARRRKGEHISYQESLKQRHAYDTLHPEEAYERYVRMSDRQ